MRYTTPETSVPQPPLSLALVAAGILSAFATLPFVTSASALPDADSARAYRRAVDRVSAAAASAAAAAAAPATPTAPTPEVPKAGESAAPPPTVPTAPVTTSENRPIERSSTGFDISWPQCPDVVPAARVEFAIIGVTGGKAFTENKCLKRQYEWAKGSRVAAQVYINVNGMKTNVQSVSCPAADTACNAYQYGWETAAHAVRVGEKNDVKTTVWWLDVQQMNWWSPDKFLNGRIIEGAKQYLESTGRQVGVYSTPYQWGEIAGGLQVNLPVWTAGARNHEDATRRCNARFAFGGGKVVLVQYVKDNFDHNYAC